MARSTLDPETRLLYGDSLKAPPGYEFDCGVATTFSMDFETALATSVSIAFLVSKNRDDVLSDHVALLEAVERTAKRLVVYADAGQIHADRGEGSRLTSLLEKTIVEVKSPGDGSFHPKLWAMRFKPLDHDDPIKMRLLILSRNLTRDRSWDAALSLDGTVLSRPSAGNRPLYDLLKQLPSMAVGSMDDARRRMTLAMADELRYAEWDMPPGCDALDLHVNGIGAGGWKPAKSRSIAVMSPFIDEEALEHLAALAPRAAKKLISRPDQLACIPKATLGKFKQVLVLDEMAEGDDGEEPLPNEQQGLHAKIFVQEEGRRTTLTLGSGNATRTALLNKRGQSTRNVEVFASLHGQKSKLGSIDDILGDQGFGRMLRAFEPDEVEATAAQEVAAEQRLLDARRTLARGVLSLRCEALQDDTKRWRLWLIPSDGLQLEELGRIRAWPITLGEGHAKDVLDGIRTDSPIDLGSVPLVDLTRFIAMEITDLATGRSEIFSTGLDVEGMPEERDLAILNWVVDSRQKFMAYLRLLLASFIEHPLPPPNKTNGNSKGDWGSGADDEPILEDLMRALCAGDGRLGAVDRLVTRMEASAKDGTDDRLPPHFKELWRVFRTVLETQDAR
ncbi:phospholipase D family protein [Mesorhizobium sp. B263B2A]|uniref:phospholipase D family protein n=1 Tax=Mesorhizobium sp. B263B2A TaxID=2876669 RepID=UPI001CD155DF|nr:phospholipase D family protein [Mesorhizobium sp. B263B2A]MCA0032647.1 phospholipase D family protein [Mesorhizobium sp. B263B2A]